MHISLARVALEGRVTLAKMAENRVLHDDVMYVWTCLLWYQTPFHHTLVLENCESSCCL